MLSHATRDYQTCGLANRKPNHVRVWYEAK